MFHYYTFHQSVTDGRTDGPTDGPTDIPSYRDARMHLKKTVGNLLSDGAVLIPIS